MERSSLVLFKQTKSGNLPLFAMKIQLKKKIKNMDQNALKKQLMLKMEEILKEVN
jgi:hypothetical protein